MALRSLEWSRREERQGRVLRTCALCMPSIPRWWGESGTRPSSRAVLLPSDFWLSSCGHFFTDWSKSLVRHYPYLIYANTRISDGKRPPAANVRTDPLGNIIPKCDRRSFCFLLQKPEILALVHYRESYNHLVADNYSGIGNRCPSNWRCKICAGY
jgi:hypothetical protein